MYSTTSARIAALEYRLYWHTPRLFSPANFRGEAQDIFGDIRSLNMLCVPRERAGTVDGLTEIDPAVWTCPVALTR